jgi:hypothetical protein
VSSKNDYLKIRAGAGGLSNGERCFRTSTLRFIEKPGVILAGLTDMGQYQRPFQRRELFLAAALKN